MTSLLEMEAALERLSESLDATGDDDDELVALYAAIQEFAAALEDLSPEARAKVDQHLGDPQDG